MYGSHLKAIPTAFPCTQVPTIQEWLLAKQKAREEANAALDHAVMRMFSRLYRKFSPFEVGQRVWLEMTNLNEGYLFKKLAPKRQGPFRIKEVLSPLVYKLNLKGQRRIYDVFHASLLTPYQETAQHGKNFLDPIPEIVDGQEKFKVDAILNHKRSYGHMYYLVVSKDQPSAKNKWLPELQL